MSEVYIPLHLSYFCKFICNSFRFLSWFNFVLFSGGGDAWGRGEGVGWGRGGEVLNHTHVAPAGRIKIQALHKAKIPPTKCLKVISSLSQLLHV